MDNGGDGRDSHKDVKSIEDLKREMFGDPSDVFRDAKKAFWDEADAAKKDKAAPVAEEAAQTPTEEVAVEQASRPADIVTETAVAAPVAATPAPAEAGDPHRDLRDAVRELKYHYDLVDRARYGEYDAYMELGRVAESLSEYSESARRNHATVKAFLISDYFEMLTMLGGSGHVSETRKINYDKTPIRELFGYIAAFDVPHDTRRCCASFVLDGDHPEILEGALGILDGSNNLFALASVSGILTDKFGKKAGFLDVDGWKRFCENKLNEFDNKRQGRK